MRFRNRDRLGGVIDASGPPGRPRPDRREVTETTVLKALVEWVQYALELSIPFCARNLVNVQCGCGPTKGSGVSLRTLSAQGDNNSPDCPKVSSMELGINWFGRHQCRKCLEWRWVGRSCRFYHCAEVLNCLDNLILGLEALIRGGLELRRE